MNYKLILKRSSIIFLQAVLVLISIGVLVFILWEPHIEGRNVGATFFQIYFNDPFLVYAYLASTPFFVALYQAFKVLQYIGQDKIFSQDAVKAVRTIKYCAMALVALIAAPVAYLLIVRPSDDIAGGVAIGLFLIFVSIVIASAAGMLEDILQNAVDIKSKND